MSERSVVMYLGKINRLDGGIVTVEGASVSYLERGRLVVQTVLRDITERVRVREELAEREQRFHGGRGGD